MRERRWAARKVLFGAALSVAVATGLAACGSSSKSNDPSGQTNSPATTAPPTTSPSGSGGASY